MDYNLKGNIAIIPARGGSTRIPKKNIIDFNGSPLIEWTIRAAIDSGIFEKIIVSTDDHEIREISILAGAEVPFLRSDFADDFSPSSLATIDCLKNAENFWNQSFKYVAQLMPTCPLRNSKSISDSYNSFIENDRDFQISAYKSIFSSLYWAHTLDKDNRAKKIFSKSKQERSQDLGEVFLPSGAIWLAKASMLKEAESFYGNNYVFEEISWLQALDIDTSYELEIAMKLHSIFYQAE